MPDDSVDGTGGRPDSVVPRSRSNRTVTPAIAGALVVLAASFALSVAFVLANGGLDLPAAQRPSDSSDVAGGAPTASASAVAAASVAQPSAGPSVSPPLETAAAVTPVPTAAATARPTTQPTSGPTRRPSSDRYDLLTACPDTPDCWIYVVRQGDNLFSIARYFGVPLDVVEARNPWTKTTPLVAGLKLLLPPPTR